MQRLNFGLNIEEVQHEAYKCKQKNKEDGKYFLQHCAQKQKNSRSRRMFAGNLMQ